MGFEAVWVGHEQPAQAIALSTPYTAALISQEVTGGGRSITTKWVNMLVDTSQLIACGSGSPMRR